MILAEFKKDIWGFFGISEALTGSCYCTVCMKFCSGLTVLDLLMSVSDRLFWVE